jgi:antitoxin PrlF
MSESTLTSKGQMTVPKDVREQLGLQPKDVMTFTVLPDGTVILRAKKRKLLDLAGVLKAPKGKRVPLAQMKR